MNNLQVKRNPYHVAGDDIIALMLNSNDVCQRVEYEFGLRAELMPTIVHNRAYIAIQTLRKMGYAGGLNDNEIVRLAGEAVTHDWLGQRAYEGLNARGEVDSILLANLPSNAGMVLEHGQKLAVRTTLAEQVRLLDMGEVSAEQAMLNAMNTLAMAGKRQSIPNEYADENGADFVRMMESDPLPSIKTGLADVDNLTGGFITGRLWNVISAMKMRKTTMMLNWALGALFTNKDISVSIHSGEMTRRQVIAQLCAMLAVAWQLKNGVYKAGDRGNAISGDALIRAGNRYKTWGFPQTDSINAAFRLYQSLGRRLQIYDKQMGLQTIDDAMRFFKRSLAINGTKLHLFDYFSIFRAPGHSMHEQAQYSANIFQDMAVGHDCSVVVLAQKNAKSVENEDGHLVGALGGIALEAAGDYNWTTHYAPHEDANKLRLTLKQSRHSAVDSLNLNIHPASGLVLDASWMVNL
jgi:hypothetical protein